MNARVLLVASGATAATRAAAFPAPDEPLLEPSTLVLPRGFARAGIRTGPERRARDTAGALGPGPVVDDALRDLGVGAWTGRGLHELPEAGVAAWLGDPAAAPHGGESIVQLLERVAAWLGTVRAPTVAVTHPAVVRGAVLHVLGAPVSAFRSLEVVPGALVDLRGGPGRWALRFPAPS